MAFLLLLPHLPFLANKSVFWPSGNFCSSPIFWWGLQAVVPVNVSGDQLRGGGGGMALSRDKRELGAPVWGCLSKFVYWKRVRGKKDGREGEEPPLRETPHVSLSASNTHLRPPSPNTHTHPTPTTCSWSAAIGRRSPSGSFSPTNQGVSVQPDLEAWLHLRGLTNTDSRSAYSECLARETMFSSMSPWF